jgi:glycosyltransferase involved in cell wall biosynthesis
VRLVIVNSLRVSGGGEKWVVRQAAALRERGVSPVIACRPDSPLAQDAAAAGLPTAAVPMRHDLSAAAVRGLAALLHRERPGAVLVCNERAYRLAAPAARLAGRPPLVYRNGLSGTFKNKWANRWWFGQVARLVVNSEPLRAEMLAFGWIPAARVALIRNGIDPAPFAPDPEARGRVREELGAGAATPVVAILARVSEEKGHADLLAALSFLPEAHLWVAGEGGLLPALREQSRTLGVADRVRFLGQRADVPALLQGADVIALPSHREGLPNAVLEAMAASRPVVASTAPGNAAVVAPGVTGELVPPGDGPALAAALERLLGDPELRARYGAAGRARVLTDFPLEGETEAWNALLRQVEAEGRR